MRSLLNVRTTQLSALETGALFMFRRPEEPPIYGIRLETPSGIQEQRPFVLLLNSPFEEEAKNFHRTYFWEAEEACLSFGKDWVIDLAPYTDDLSVHGSPDARSCIAISADGIYFRTSHQKGGYVHYFHSDTFGQVERIGDTAFHLGNYDIYLSKSDAEYGRPPIYSHT